mmetsp:Transcript_84895/g.197410  ORF Transcript_84895/g.197410 Transcript_84895/m.197410 type:complete len:259 (+) Transcript_84895:297-1073(+)
MRMERSPTHSTTTRISIAFAPMMAAPVSGAHSPSLMRHLKPDQPWTYLKPSPQSKRAAANTPQAPHAPWIAKASKGSSTFTNCRRSDEAVKTMAPMMPMQRAEPHSTLLQPAVIETRPARMPLQNWPTSYRRRMAKRIKKTTTPQAEAEIVVFIATCAALKPSSLLAIDKVEPQLKPYQPNHRMNVPNTINGKLCGAYGSIASFSRGGSLVNLGDLKRPARGPAITAPTSAPTPPHMCTMPLPAKSTYPETLISARKP